MPTYLSEAIYTANGATTDFAFNKGYLSRSHVVVKTSADAGVTFTTKTDGVDYNWIDSQTVRFVAAPANNTVVWIDRTTPLSLLVTYENGAVFTDDNQNTAYRHAIYVLQEQADDLQRRPDLNPLLDDAEGSLADAFVSDVSIEDTDLIEAKRTLTLALGRDENGRLTVTLTKSGSTEQTNTLPSAAPLRRFRFKSGDEDHIVCRTWDGTTEGSDDVLIALDPQLRQSLVGSGYTYSTFQARTRDSDSRAESIQPGYTLNDNVFAIQVNGGAGVSVDDEALVWLEVIPNRHWTHLCEEGS